MLHPTCGLTDVSAQPAIQCILHTPYLHIYEPVLLYTKEMIDLLYMYRAHAYIYMYMHRIDERKKRKKMALAPELYTIIQVTTRTGAAAMICACMMRAEKA